MSLTKNEILERIENGLFEYYISKDDNEYIPPLPDHFLNILNKNHDKRISKTDSRKQRIKRIL